MRITSALFSLSLAACGSAPPSAQTPSQNLGTHETSSGSPRIPVLNQQSCPVHHDCNIVEVIDLHTTATSEDKGFDELRKRAAERGADAVIGAEFEHGDKDEPSHLSGMIVRYGEPVPPHVEIGAIDIPSDENNQDKGLATLAARGHAMGGDQVIDVTFEHGDDGAQGHLRGKVIRFTH